MTPFEENLLNANGSHTLRNYDEYNNNMDRSMSRPSTKNIFTFLNQTTVTEAAISGKLNLREHGVEPSPVSGRPGYGQIGTLGSCNWTTITVSQK